jgi:hypothetical protein
VSRDARRAVDPIRTRGSKKKRSAGGLLELLKPQHFDSMISLARRVAVKFARFSGVGSDGESQIVDGTIGNLVGTLLMQLVDAPTSRPDKGHLWGLMIAAKYNGDGTATPVFGDWATRDDDIEPLAVDTSGSLVAPKDGDVGIIFRATDDDHQKLLFLFFGSPAGGGGVSWFYGDGFDGSMTIDGSDFTPMLLRLQYDSSFYSFTSPPWTQYASAGVAIPNDQWVQWASTHGAGGRSIFASELTIAADTTLVMTGESVNVSNSWPTVFCVDTLTIDGEISVSGGYRKFAIDNIWPIVLSGAGGPGGSDAAGQAGIDGVSEKPPFDEVRVNAAGSGGASGDGFSGGAGGAGGELPIKPGEGALGPDDAGTAPSARVTFDQLGLVGSFDNNHMLIAGGSGGGGGGGGPDPMFPGIGGIGGQAGGVLIIRARTIVGTGKITADGGDGGTAQPVANGGGGGGGNPGAVIIICDSFDSRIGVTANPGKGSPGYGLGATGSDALGTGYIRIIQAGVQIYP